MGPTDKAEEGQTNPVNYGKDELGREAEQKLIAMTICVGLAPMAMALSCFLIVTACLARLCLRQELHFDHAIAFAASVHVSIWKYKGLQCLT